MSTTLKQTTLRIINDSQCNPLVDLNQLYCALGTSNLSNTCEGDSGAPLMYNLNGSWFIYGITSFGETTIDGQYCNNSLPAYYTKIKNYLDWMNSNNISSINQIKKSNADNLGYLSKKVILFMVLMVNTIELY